MEKRWEVREPDPGLLRLFERDLDVLPVTARILANRGLVDSDRAFSFLRPRLKDLRSPFLMKDMDRAVGRTVEAVERGETIALYGDYDVDGATATALLHSFFRDIGAETVWYIPDRLGEGYGLNAGAVEKLAARGVKLLITADCGVSNGDEIRRAAQLGVDVIVTDHHEMPPEPPPALALLNPKQPGCAFPFKGLAGVGVAFFFLMALRSRLRELGRFRPPAREPNLARYLDMVAVGTVADMVPLVEENRVMVSHGLKVLAETARPGLRALKEVAGLGAANKVSAGAVAFQLAPRINAGGRVGSAGAAVELLVCSDMERARRLASELDAENTRRQGLEAAILEEALAMLAGGCDDRAIVLGSEGWHPGVIGIVASRLVDRFSRPTVLIGFDGEVGKGSARSIRGFDILEAIRSCSALLDKYGGHRAAAGLSIRRGLVERFREEFTAFANERLDDEDLRPLVEVDALVSLEELNGRLLSEIEMLGPFGVSNSEPVLGAVDAQIIQTRVVGERHLKMTLRQNGAARSAMGFGLADMHPMSGGGFDIAFSPYLSEWQGVKELRLKVRDIRRPSA
ncbi:MAG TPA: single-stranded-DNA-specific exonuclease RecJ [Deltaproteobacteria bacterium]|nr:single-stranded-DNA-specific exonuclease RecJ [Deltaproteobacteria bacterium]